MMTARGVLRNAWELTPRAVEFAAEQDGPGWKGSGRPTEEGTSMAQRTPIWKPSAMGCVPVYALPAAPVTGRTGDCCILGGGGDSYPFTQMGQR